MDLTFGCVLSQAAYGPMAGPTAIRTGAATHISGHFSGIEPPLFVRRTPAVRRAQEPERGTSAGCWASASMPGSVCREATEFSVRRFCPPAVSFCTPRISPSSKTPVVVRGLQRAHSPHPNTLRFRALSNTVSGLPRQHGRTHGDETGGVSESRSPISPRQPLRRKRRRQTCPDVGCPRRLLGS